MCNTYSATHITAANGSVLLSNECSCSSHFHIKISNNKEKLFEEFIVINDEDQRYSKSQNEVASS
jgi:hypothetical protein